MFIERRGGRWEQRMASIARECGLRLSPFHELTGGLDAGDEPSLLGEVYTQLSNAERNAKRPRNSWRVVYSLGIKE